MSAPRPVSTATRDELQAAIDCALYLLRTRDTHNHASAPITEQQRIILARGLLAPYSTEAEQGRDLP